MFLYSVLKYWPETGLKRVFLQILMKSKNAEQVRYFYMNRVLIHRKTLFLCWIASSENEHFQGRPQNGLERASSISIKLVSAGVSESGNKLFEVKLVSNSVNIHVRSIFDGFAAFIWPKGCVTPEIFNFRLQSSNFIVKESLIINFL